ncbi:MAG: NADH-quinone oxidoreductase subunit M [Candidatus Eiseniibacteriota bacterium]|jgi:NADH-quinone oxidoreductase subunit M
MILVTLIFLLLAAGLIAWPLAHSHPRAARWLCVAALAADLVMVLGAWAAAPSTPAGRLLEAGWSWIPRFGIRFDLAMDGVSLVLVALTMLIGLVGVAASWTEIRTRVGFFHFNLMVVLAGVTGVFLAADLFLFYFFWELMLVPMYLMIAIWGHERRIRAAVRFFIFTQAGGLCMLVAIIALALLHQAQTGVLTFEMAALGDTALTGRTAMWLLAGFSAAFLVKLPAFPLHTWLPDAHTEAPTAGSVVLAGLMLKTGAYGLLRLVLPLFPDAAARAAPLLMALAVAGILYGAVLAFAQRDLKRLVAYTSVSHLGFALLGLFAGTALALQGVVLQLVCHGLSTGGLFLVAGMLQERLHTRDLSRMGGFWAQMPRMGGATLVLAMAALGLPGLGNFIAEFLILFGSYERAPVATTLAAAGLVVAAIYALRLFQEVFHGSAAPREAERGTGADGAGGAAVGGGGEPRRTVLADLSAREAIVLAVLLVALLVLGWYPQPLIDVAAPALAALVGLTGPIAGVPGS